MNSDLNIPQHPLPPSSLEPKPPLELFLSQPLSSNQLSQLSPGALAYLGDAIYELYIRRSYLFPAKRIHAYHRQVVAQVRAEAQAQQLEMLMPQLTPDELEWLRRGRNAVTGGSRRVEAQIYQQATSLETLVGYLYLTNPQRLLDLLNQLDLMLSSDI